MRGGGRRAMVACLFWIGFLGERCGDDGDVADARIWMLRWSR
jgi:hypothetical protein